MTYNHIDIAAKLIMVRRLRSHYCTALVATSIRVLLSIYFGTHLRCTNVMVLRNDVHMIATCVMWQELKVEVFLVLISKIVGHVLFA